MYREIISIATDWQHIMGENFTRISFNCKSFINSSQALRWQTISPYTVTISNLRVIFLVFWQFTFISRSQKPLLPRARLYIKLYKTVSLSFNLLSGRPVFYSEIFYEMKFLGRTACLYTWTFENPALNLLTLTSLKGMSELALKWSFLYQIGQLGDFLRSDLSAFWLTEQTCNEIWF